MKNQHFEFTELPWASRLHRGMCRSSASLLCSLFKCPSSPAPVYHVGCEGLQSPFNASVYFSRMLLGNEEVSMNWKQNLKLLWRVNASLIWWSHKGSPSSTINNLGWGLQKPVVRGLMKTRPCGSFVGCFVLFCLKTHWSSSVFPGLFLGDASMNC